MFKFELDKKVYVAGNPQPMNIIARTEFSDGRQPRYCIESESPVAGKEMNQDWVNEDKISAVSPKSEDELAEVKTPSILQGKNLRGMKVREIKKG